MYKISILSLIIITCCFQSCQLEDDSNRIDQTNSVLIKELLEPAIKQVAFNQSALGGRSTAVIMQYLQEEDASIQIYKNYFLGPILFESMWSTGFYSGSLASLSNIRDRANEENEEDIKAISLILLAHEYGALTNMFGDIPFSEAIQGESGIKPKYDTQEEVYEGIMNMLDEAIEIIKEKAPNDNLIAHDLIYQGNLNNWNKFANGLKARYLFNQRNQNSNLDQEILSLLNNSFTNSDEQAEFTYDATFVNPQHNFAVERPATLYSGDHFINQLLSTEDPRISNLVSLVDNDWVHFHINFIPKWYNQTASIPILSYTELLFMKAELSVHIEMNQSETSILLKEAITSSMLDNNIDLVDSVLIFLATNSNLNGLNNEAMLQKIIEESYVAYYGYNHLQAWNNYRRTRYPELTPTTSNPNEFNPSSIVPRRFLYPESELKLNFNNVQEARSRQLGAFLDSDMWIFN